MGMFDYISVPRVLPDGLDGTGLEFQTKDLECLLDLYEIQDNDYLVFVDTKNNPEGNYSEWSRTLIDYTGMIDFYSRVNETWHEYRAKFFDGKLVKIKEYNRYNTKLSKINF